MRGLFLFPLLLARLAAQGCTGAPEPETIELGGSPFKIVVANDGCQVFASMAGKSPGLAFLRRSGPRLRLEQVLKTPGPLTGLALTHDGRTVLATSGKSVLFIDVAKAAVTGQIDEQDGDGKVYVNVTADDKTAFVSNERSRSISVIDVTRRSVVGRIPVGNAPIALTFSPDQRWLYTTSQSATPDWGWPAVCDPESLAATPGKHAKGAVVIIDVASRTVKEKVEAGCNPVRLSLSPDGKRAYVTARKDNKVLVFDTAKFDRIAEIEVGVAPVPVAVVNGGRTVLVGNSNRFAAGEAKPQSISVIDAVSNKVTGMLSAGAFPRDIVASPDGKTIYIANFASNSIAVVDAALASKR